MKEYRKYAITLSIVGLLLILTGVTYSFFNYTRTGAINNLGTGRIYFSSSQSDTLNITNLFPMTSTEAGSANLDAVTISITGDTTYVSGEEYEISIVDVTNTVNGKEVPMNYIATYTADIGGTIGTSDSDYWVDRNDKDASIYSLNATGKVEEGKQVLVGYIDNGSTGINGTLTISAYIDADRIAISDTYYENAPSPSPSASPLVSPTDEYGTTSEWVNERTVFTTTEWNSLSSTPISFKIRAESNEGIWLQAKIASCPDCKFIYHVSDLSDSTTFLYTTWNMAGFDEVNNIDIPETPSVLTTGLYDNYEELINVTGKDYFLGVKLNSQNQVTNVYACGVKDSVPFCLEGALDSSLGGTQNVTTYLANQTLLQGEKLFNNTCGVFEHIDFDHTTCGLNDSFELYAITESRGNAEVGIGFDDCCAVGWDGYFGCIESAGD